jgi:hypothetical protein
MVFFCWLLLVLNFTAVIVVSGMMVSKLPLLLLLLLHLLRLHRTAAAAAV